MSRWFPLLALTQNPNLRIAIVSYEHGVARRWGRAIRGGVGDIDPVEASGCGEIPERVVSSSPTVRLLAVPACALRWCPARPREFC